MFRLAANGDSAVSIIFENEISQRVLDCVLAMQRAIEDSPKRGILLCIASYHTLLVEYDPLELSFGQVCLWLRGLKVAFDELPQGRLVELPVCYDNELATDMQRVCKHTALCPNEVIRLHSEAVYRVYAIGFKPGFPYLGGMNERLSTPRLLEPKTKIAKGSVAIGGGQTGIYPQQSPGGWNIIGRTPIDLFANGKPLLRVGDRLKFIPIDYSQYCQLEGQTNA